MADSPNTLTIPLKDVDAFLKDPTAIKVYANGFVIGRTPSDLFLISIRNGNPEVLVNLSFGTAKNLLGILDKNIKEIESLIGEIKPMPSIVVSQPKQ